MAPVVIDVRDRSELQLLEGVGNVLDREGELRAVLVALEKDQGQVAIVEHLHEDVGDGKADAAKEGGRLG